jgi:DNA-directed RNA polymerase subunit P
MVDESNIEMSDVDPTDSITETEKFDVIYSCLRCSTKVSSSELSRLPEIKCICGFRVFTKVRPPIVKTVKAL